MQYFLLNSQHLYVSVVLVWSLWGDKQPSYKHFPSVGAFSHTFSIARSGRTTDRIKKVRGDGMDLLYHHAKYGGDCGSHAGRRQKSVMFFVCFFVTLWNDEVCDNGNATKQCKFKNNYGVTASRKVCSCSPIFNFFCGPQNFPLKANLYQKRRFSQFLRL